MTIFKLFIAIAIFASSSVVLAQRPICKIDPFDGGALPQGALAQMVVSNFAAQCAIDLYGLARERRNPAESGEITTVPKHGTAEFSAPQARYMPEPGYVGADEFEFIAHAVSRSGKPLRLKVRVVVDVVQ